MTQGYGAGAIKALQDAGRPIVPVVGFSYNVHRDRPALRRPAPSASSASNPAYLSSEAIKLAVDILDRQEAGRALTCWSSGDFLTTDPFDLEALPGRR